MAPGPSDAETCRFQEEWEKAEPVLQRICARWTQWNEAEELVQEAAVGCWRMALGNRLILDNGLVPVGTRIARNAFLNRLRRRRLEARFFQWARTRTCPADAAQGSSGPAEEAELREALQVLSQFLAALEPRLRRAFELKHRDGLTFAEIAEELGGSLTGNWHWVKKAEQRVLDFLDGLDEGYRGLWERTNG